MLHSPLINEELMRDARFRLSQHPRSLWCKWFYDERGSALFDAICELPEYYLTRTEASILKEYSQEIAGCLGSGINLIEPGAGSSQKTRLLLRSLVTPSSYVPIDISREHLLQSAANLEREFPGLNVYPVVADYTQPLELPPTEGGANVLFFPGSTLGNFHPDEAAAFLRRLTEWGGALLIGIDLVKPLDVLLPAYNDAAGVTAQFNLNILERLNREANANFDVTKWRHEAVWNQRYSAVEMRLIACEAHRVQLGGKTFEFKAGEAICTEYSHKYTLENFARVADAAGWGVEAQWSDPRSWFSVQLLRLKKRQFYV